MRFSVQRKIVLLGAGLSFLLMIAAFLTSFFIYKSRSQDNYIKSIDNSIDELENTIADSASIEDMCPIVLKALMIYLDNMSNEVPEFKTADEKYEYYADLYNIIYPSKGFGLYPEKLKYQNTYLDISSSLTNASISAGTKIAYAGIILDPSITNDDGRLLYLFDSKFRFGNTEGNFFGTDYKMTQNDIDVDQDSVRGEFIINGKNARTLDIKFGTFKELAKKVYDDNTANSILEDYSDEVANMDVTVTAFIEYDLKILNADYGFFALIEGISLTAVLIILAIFYILIARFVIVKNIVELTSSTKEFTNKIKDGENINVINPNIKSKDEIGELSESFVKMEEEIINYTEKIEQATTEREKLNAELSVASTIQLEALPKKTLNDHKVLIEASIKSAKEVGGDFYDYFYIDDNHLAVIVSDVSGKGVPAALFMMRAKELIKSKLIMNKNIEDVCFEVNNELLENNDAGLFITAFIGILDFEKLEFEIVNCGHERPYIIRNDNVERYEVESNFILGGLEDYKYIKNVIKLDKGNIVFIHTDGLNESINDEREEFGYDRIIEALKVNSKNRLSEMLEELSKELNTFTNNADAFDDVTMLVLELKSPKLRFEYNNPDYSIIDEVTNKFDDYYSYLNQELLSKINIIIDELLNNYISYDSNGNLIITVDINYVNNELVIQFSNNGVEFNPLEKEVNYIEEYSDDLKIGGLGLTIIKSFAADINYERKADFNILTMKFKA